MSTRKYKSLHLALQLYAKNPELQGGFGQVFGTNLKALQKYEENPFKGAYSFKFPKNHKNIQQTVHGGALATLIDIATTITMLRLTPQRTISISLNTQFLRVTEVQSYVQIETEITKIGKQIIYSDCLIYAVNAKNASNATDTNTKDRKLSCKGTHTKMIMKDDWDFVQKWQQSQKNKKQI